MSANAQKQLDALLRHNNFRLVRQTKHRIWRNPDGKVFVTSATPSDWRAVKNQVTDLKRVIASDPVPEVLAVSEFERREALAILARQEKKTGGTAAGPAKSKGCGFSYIDEKKAVTSTLAPEQKQAEHDQRAWESLVRKTRQEFVASIVSKHRVIMPKYREDLLRRYREYANGRLAYEIRRHYDYIDRGQKVRARSQMDLDISATLQSYSSQVTKLLGRNFYNRAENCQFCKKKDDGIYFCFEHGCERRRTAALNIDKFLVFTTTEEIAKQAEKMFAVGAMKGMEVTVSAPGSGFPRSPRILWRYAARKANELAQQLLAARPMGKAA